MPLSIRSACRLAPVALVAAMAFVALSAQAQTPPPVGGTTITIQPPDGAEPETISTADIDNGDMNTTYTVARPAGGTRKLDVADGISVLQLLEETDTDSDYATVEIPRPHGGGTLRLTKEQIEDVKPPGFYTDAQGATRFVGPTRANGSVAAENDFAVGEAVTLTQVRASRLKVRIDPRREKIELGGSVSFRATVTGFEEGERVTYKWGIKGKRQRFAGPRYTQDFPERDGVYELQVAVRIEGSSDSETAVARIVVGDPQKADSEQDGDGDTTDGSDGGGSTYDGGSDYDPGATYAPSYSPPSTATPPPPSAPPPVRQVEPSPAPDISTDTGTTVAGNLLADAANPPPSNILESAREGAEADEESPGAGAGVPEAALSIAGVLALLGLGAGIENRQGRRPRLRRPSLPRIPLPRRGA